MTSSRVLIFFMVASLILRLFLCFQSPEVLIPKVLSDDMFYYLCIARNIAQGLGATADGENITNGFHPLWALTLVPLYWIFGDTDGMLQWSLLLLSVFSVLSAWFVYKISRLACGEVASLLAALIWLFCPYAVLISLSGVEVPIFVLLLGATSYYYLLLKRRDSYSQLSLWRWFGLGILAGAAVLARVDGLVLAAFIFIDSLTGKRTMDLRRRCASSLSFACACFLMTLPWFVWSYLRTGFLLQVSGKAIHYQQHFIFWAQNINTSPLQYALAWLNQVLTNINAGIYSMAVLCGLSPRLLLAIVILFAVAVLAAAVMNPQPFRKWLRKTSSLLFLFCYGLVIFLLYCAYLWYNQNWYYYSAFFVVCIMVGCIFGLLDGSLFRRLPRAVMIVVWTALFIFVLIFSSYQTFSWWERGIRGWQIDGYRAALWVRDNIPGESRIGSFNSGFLAYYCPQVVINLDGVVNASAYRAMKEGKSFSYIRKERIDYIVEAPLSLRFRSAHSEREFLSSLKGVHTEATYPEAILRANPVTVYRLLY